MDVYSVVVDRIKNEQQKEAKKGYDRSDKKVPFHSGLNLYSNVYGV